MSGREVETYMPQCSVVLDERGGRVEWAIEVEPGTLRPQDVEAWFWHLAEAAAAARLMNDCPDAFAAEVQKTAGPLKRSNNPR